MSLVWMIFGNWFPFSSKTTLFEGPMLIDVWGSSKTYVDMMKQVCGQGNCQPKLHFTYQSLMNSFKNVNKGSKKGENLVNVVFVIPLGGMKNMLLLTDMFDQDLQALYNYDPSPECVCFGSVVCSIMALGRQKKEKKLQLTI